MANNDNIYGLGMSDTDAPAYSSIYGVEPTEGDLQQIMRDERRNKLSAAKLSKQAKLGYDIDQTLQQNLSNAIDAQIYTKPDGSLYTVDYQPAVDQYGEATVNPVEVPYTATNKFGPDVRDLYIDDTKEGNYKLGLARTDQGGFTGRYDPNVHPTWDKPPDGELAGPRGVTREDGPLLNITLPRDYATAFEYGVHSDVDQMKNRAMGTGPKTSESQAEFGAGQTEYTTPNAPMWNADYVRSGGTVDRNTPLPEDPKYYTNNKTDVPVSPAQTDSDAIDALQSAGLKLYGKGHKGIGNILSSYGEWQESYNKKHENDTIKGDIVSEGIAGIQKSFADGMKDAGEYLSKRGDFIEKNADVYVGYSGSGGKMASDVWGNLKKGEVIKALDSVTLDDTMSLVAESVPEMTMYSNPYTMAVVYAGNVAEAKEEAEQLNKGKKISDGRMAAILLGEAASMGMEKWAIGKMVGVDALKAKGADILSNIAGKAPKAIAVGAGAYITKKAGAIAEAMVAEGSQEVVQEGQRILTTELGQKDIMTEENLDKLGTAAVGGALVGGSIKGTGEAYNTAKDFNTYTKDKQTEKIAKNVKETVKDKLSPEEIAAYEEIETKMDTSERYSSEDAQAIYDNAVLQRDGRLEAESISKEDIEKGLEDTLEATIDKVILNLADAGKEPKFIKGYVDAVTKTIEEEGYFKTEETTAPIDETEPTTELSPETQQAIKEIEATMDAEMKKDTPDEVVLTALRERLLELEGDILASTEPKKVDVKETPVSEDKAVNEKVGRAGLVNVLTPQDKAAGLSIELTTMDEGERLTNIGKTKTKALDVYDVDDKVFSMILNDDFTVDTMEELIQGKNITNMKERLTGHLESAAKVQKEIKGIADTLSKTMATDKGKAILDGIFNDTEITLEKALRATALALNGVRSGITSEADINIQNGLEIPTHKGARRLGLNVQLGKELYNSYGIKVAGEASVINRKYAEVGDKIIALAEEAGLVKVKKDQEVVAHKLYTEEGKSLYTEKELHKAGIEQAKDRKNASGKTTPMMVDDVVVLVDNKSASNSRTVESETGYAMSTLTKLLKPINYELPTTEPVKEVKVAPGMTISEKHEKIVQDINELSYNIKPEFIQLMKEVKKVIGKYKNTDEAMRQDPLIAGLIGVENTNTALNKLSEEGRSSNRKRDLLQILENLDMFDEKGQFHFNYDMAVNQRIHVVQTILDFQGGKYMNRPMITGGKYTTNNKKEYDFLVESIAEESKLPVDTKAVEAYMKEHKVSKKEATKKLREAEVKKPTNEYILDAMRMLKEDGNIELHQLLELAKNLGSNNPIALLADLRAIYDISTAKDYKVTTSSQAQADAKASGIMNTMLNLSGVKEVQKLLAKLGIGKEGTELSDLDPYLILLDGVKKHWKGTTYSGTINPVETKLGKLGLDIRDIAKYAIIPWFYGQHYKNTEVEMANSIAVDVVNIAIEESNQDAVDEVNEILGSKKYSIDSKQEGQEGTTDIQNITTKDVDKLTAYYKKNIAKYYVAAIDSTFPGVTEYRNKVGQLYEILEANGWKGGLRTAMSALEGESDEGAFKHKMDVRKNKQTFTKSIDGESVVAYNKMFNNETSLKVNPQHSSDAALLLKSIGNVIAELKEAGKEVPGIMTVHDNVITTPEVALMIKREYDRLTVELAGKYDFLHAVELEVLDIVKEKTKTGDTKGAKNIQAKLDKIMEGEAEVREAKAEYLDGLEVSILGSRDIKLDAKETIKKAPKAKAEGKAEPKAEKKVNPVDDVYKNVIGMMNIYMNGTKGKISAENKAKIVEELGKLEAVVSNTHKATLAKVLKALEGNIDIEKTTQFEGTTGVIGIEVKGLKKDPRTNYKTIMNPDMLVEILGHEIDHALEYEYIDKNMNSSEVKYLKKVLDKVTSKVNMKKLSPYAQQRIKTSINNETFSDARKITELASVLRNETGLANEILASIAVKQSIIQKVLHRLYEAFKAYIAKKTPAEISEIILDGIKEDNEIGILGTVAALQQLSDQAEVYLAENPDSTFSMKGNIKSKRDIYNHAYLSPYEAANSIVARQNAYISKYMMVYGGALIDVLSPSVKAAHEKGMSESDLYKGMINVIRTGMMSETAQQMAQFLKVTGDSKKELLDNLQGVATDIAQESVALHEEMAVLDRLIKKTYPDKKDQVRIYQIFSKTGISNLTADKDIMKSVMDGKLDIKEALKKVESQVENKGVLNEVADVYLGVSTRPDRINTKAVRDHTDTAKMYVALRVLSKIDGAEDMLNSMSKPIKQKLMHLAIVNQTMSEQVNERGNMYEGDTYAKASRYYNDYDGHYSMDIHDGQYTFNMVTEKEMKSSRYSEDEDWILLKEPKGDNVGLVARKLLAPMNTPGMGLNYNRFNNGFYMDEQQSQKMSNKLDMMDDPDAYLNENGIVRDGNRFRFLLDEKTKVEKLGMMQNVAEGLYRTMIHNKELIESQTARNMIIDAGIQKVETEEELWELNDFLVENKKKAIDKRDETYPFIYINPKAYDGYDSLPPQIKLLYKTPENLTTYEGFNEKVTLVKKAEAHEILGHKNVQFFSDNRGMAKAEMIFKNLVAMSKLHMVVTAPLKLATDIASNIGILSTMDVPFTQIGRGGKKGWEGYSRISRLRSELGVLQMEARMAKANIKIEGSNDSYDSLLKKIESKKKQIEKDDFYDAYKAGFIQSYSTSLIIKEFDVISGLQKDIDTVIDSVTTDKDGNPNGVHKAIKTWMKFGLEIDSLLASASKLSKVNGTSVGKELESLAGRLKSKKDAESVARYVSEIIGSPSSEVVTYGGAAMVISDALSKYILAKHLLGELGGPRMVNPKTNKQYTKVEAYAKANETFIDFRYNMPPSVKALSDYGILMFPSFWMRTQKVIASLILYHPATAIGGYMIEDYLNMGSANILDANFIDKVVEGTVTHDPMSILSANSVAWWL